MRLLGRSGANSTDGGEAEAGHQPRKLRCLSSRKASVPSFDANGSIFFE